MIKETTIDHKEKLLSIIENSGQFDEDGLNHVRLTLEDHFENPGNAMWFTAYADDAVGVAYCAPEPISHGTWNLLMLWIEDGQEGKGHGSALMARIERELLEVGARILIVETSGTDDFEFARKFYEKIGFTQEGRIKDFFDDGDDKLVYSKRVKRGS